MLRPSTARNCVILLIAATLLTLIAARGYRSTRVRGWVSRGVAPIVWLLTPTPPTRDELRADELQRRTVKRMPRPARQPYPDRPRVALMDFGIDANTWHGDQAARQLSAALSEALQSDTTIEWLPRNAFKSASTQWPLAMGPGTEMGASSTALAVERGVSLNCTLIVTGRFIDTAADTQRLRLAVINLHTAGRVAELEQPWPEDLHQALAPTKLDALRDTVHELVTTAHQRLIAQRDAPVLSLLFFHNLTGHEHLNHLDTAFRQRLKHHDHASTALRFTPITPAGSHHAPHDMPLAGLGRRGPNAWARTADYYLWGHYTESPAASATSQASTPPTSAEAASEGPASPRPSAPPSTTVTLYLWSGMGPPQVFTRTAPFATIDTTVNNLADAVWQASQIPVGPELTPDHCETVVDLLTRRLDEGLLMTTATRPPMPSATGRKRRAWASGHANQAAWFFRPDDVALARRTLMNKDPEPLSETSWLSLRTREAQVDHVVNRFGAAVADDWGIMLQKLDVLVRRAGLFVAASRPPHPSFAPDMGEIPPDMPPAALHAEGLDIVARMAAFGRLCSTHPPDPAGERLRTSPSSILLENMRLTPQQTAHLWTQWWPYFQPQWQEEHTAPDRTYFHDRFLKKLSHAYTAAGRTADYNAMFALPAVPAESAAPTDPVQPLNSDAKF